MDKIKTLVRYDANEMTIWDADDESLGFFTPDGSDVDAIGNQIANALNNAADQSRVIEGLIEGLKHYADESFWDDPHPDLRYGEGTQYNFEDEIAGQMPGYQVAQAVIAEAQRILEGK